MFRCQTSVRYDIRAVSGSFKPRNTDSLAVQSHSTRLSMVMRSPFLAHTRLHRRHVFASNKLETCSCIFIFTNAHFSSLFQLLSLGRI